jgi:hypothetical protein
MGAESRAGEEGERMQITSARWFVIDGGHGRSATPRT